MRIIVDENIPFAREALGSGAEVILRPGRSLQRADLAGADALLVRSVTKVDHALLGGTPVRFIGTATIGTDHVDLDYLRTAGIGFSSAQGCNAWAVVQWVVSVALALTAEEAGGDATSPWLGRTVGIVGHGNIGSRLAGVARGLGFRVVCCDPPLARAGHAPAPGERFLPLEDVLAQADIVTLHVPLLRTGPDCTLGMISMEPFEAMARRRPFFLNAARGEAVEELALRHALSAGWLRAAALDVFQNEPAIAPATLAAVRFATPHIAGYSLEGKVNGTRIVTEALRHHLGMSGAWPTALNPAPAGPVPAPAPSVSSPEAQLRGAVRAMYDIARDDGAMRAECSDFGRHFDMLRRDYPHRREFSAYCVRPGDGWCPQAIAWLQALGCTVADAA